MSEYLKINLIDFIKELGENRVISILSDFSSPKNQDIEFFLKQKAIEFSKKGLAQTQLIFYKNNEEICLVGYYAITNKTICIKKEALSKTLAKRISKFATYDINNKSYTIPALLIGQLSKNYSNGNDALISGDELIELAFESIKEAQKIIGGKVVFLECEDEKKLIDFYTKHNFSTFGKRQLDRDEVEVINGRYLLQMITYID